MAPTAKKIKGLLGPEVSYVDLLDDDLLAKAAAEAAGPRTRNPLRPSASGYCARRLAYDFNEYRGHARYEPESREPNILRLLQFGHGVEYHVLRMLGDVELLQVKYKQQVLSFFPISETELIEGSTDFVVYSKTTRGLGDVKSVGDKFRSKWATKWSETDKKLRSMESVKKISPTGYWIEDLPAFIKEYDDPFLADNLYQINLYSMNSFMQERGIDHGFALQYNKNNSEMREIRFKPSVEAYEYVRDKFQTIAAAIDGGHGPEAIPQEAKLGSIRCAFCHHAPHCRPGVDTRQAFFATFRNKE